MARPGDVWAESINKRKQIDTQGKNDMAQMKAKEIMQGLIGGTLEQTQNPQESVVSEQAPLKPRNIGELIKSGLGMPSTQETMYKRTGIGKEWKPQSQEEALQFEQAKAGMKPWKPQTREEQLQFETEKADVTTQAQEQRKMDKIKTDMDFSVNSVKNLMVPMIRSFRSMRDVTQKQTGLDAGRLAGAVNLGGRVLGYNPESRAFEGQKLELAAALARIAMPGIRSEKAIQTFLKTLPAEGSTDQEAENQVRNSLHNAFSRGYAAQGLDYDQEAQNKTEEVISSILSEQAYGEPGKQSTQIKTFATPEEAEASGYKGEAIIGGRRARID